MSDRVVDFLPGIVQLFLSLVDEHLQYLQLGEVVGEGGVGMVVVGVVGESGFDVFLEDF